MSKRYAVITGVASGIGNEIAKILYEEGVMVFGLDINQCQEEYYTYVCDVSDENQIREFVNNLSEKVDRIDYLVNAAGLLTIGKPLMIKDMSIKQWDAIMRINLKSVLIMMKELYPLLKKSKEASIVNISSEQSLYPEIGFSPYAVSKAGINTITMCAAKEFLQEKIRVNAIALGTVKTNILDVLQVSNEEINGLFEKKDQTIPFGVMNTTEVCNVICFLLSKQSKYMTGETIRCDGGMYLGK